jgi:hypothetical protein
VRALSGPGSGRRQWEHDYVFSRAMQRYSHSRGESNVDGFAKFVWDTVAAAIPNIQ